MDRYILPYADVESDIIKINEVYFNMASVNFKKLKSANDVKAMLRHCDKEERLKHEHSNKEINKDLTYKNITFVKADYRATCKRFDNRIKTLDETTNTNKRKDRVQAFGLTIPACKDMSDNESKHFFQDVIKHIIQKFGKDNIVWAGVHYDEIHDYIDGKNIETSRAHMHVYVVPEISGKLDGKTFSSKANMIALNNEIDSIARDKYKTIFLTNEKPRKKSVEELKVDSVRALKAEVKRLSENIQRGNETVKSQAEHIQRQSNEITRLNNIIVKQNGTIDELNKAISEVQKDNAVMEKLEQSLGIKSKQKSRSVQHSYDYER